VKDEKKGGWRRYLGLPSLLGSVMGAGTGYLAVQAGSITYLAAREIINLISGQPLSSIPEILKDYALYTSLGGAVGEAAGSLLARKCWRAINGGE